MDISKQDGCVVGSTDKSPLTLLKPALAFKKDGSPSKVEVAFVEQTIGELVAVNGDFLLEERLIEKDCHGSTQSSRACG